MNKVTDRIVTLERLMRQGWDRRVEQEYRYWMSDGVQDDQTMWESGSRDLEILLKHFTAVAGDQTALEVGCGVGRLIRPAAKSFSRVYGIDVSESAILRSQKLLADLDNAETHCGSGSTLAAISDEAIDFCFSFAAFGHMPVQIMIANLFEVNRVLKPGGSFALQFYLGSLQETVEEDSFTIRSYPENFLSQVFTQLGFEVAAVEELKLPFDAADYEAGLVPHILYGSKTGDTLLSHEEIYAMLLPGGEPQAPEAWPGSKFEYRMAVTRVHQLIAEKSFAEAKKTLEFILETYSDPEPGILEVLAELSSE